MSRTGVLVLESTLEKLVLKNQIWVPSICNIVKSITKFDNSCKKQKNLITDGLPLGDLQVK